MKNVSILVIIGINRETIDVTEGHEREQGRLRTVRQRHDRTRIGGGNRQLFYAKTSGRPLPTYCRSIGRTPQTHLHEQHDERLSRKTVDGVTASSTVFRMATAPLMLVCTRIRYVTADE